MMQDAFLHGRIKLKWSKEMLDKPLLCIFFFKLYTVTSLKNSHLFFPSLLPNLVSLRAIHCIAFKVSSNF